MLMGVAACSRSSENQGTALQFAGAAEDLFGNTR